MIGMILRGVAGAARVAFNGSANAARATTELAVSSVSSPIAHALHLAHGAGTQMIANGAGQMIQSQAAALTSHATSSASAGLGSLSIPSGADGLASIVLPAAGGAAASGGAVAAAPQAAPIVTEATMRGALPMQGIALPLMPEGSMRIG